MILFIKCFYLYLVVRLSNGPNSKAGGLEMYHNGDWFTVCDTDFGLAEAKVACRSLKTQYIDARAIPGIYLQFTALTILSN